MNAALARVDTLFDAFFATDDTEPGFKQPTAEEVERVRREVDEIKRRNREATPVPMYRQDTHGDR